MGCKSLIQQHPQQINVKITQEVGWIFISRFHIIYPCNPKRLLCASGFQYLIYLLYRSNASIRIFLFLAKKAQQKKKEEEAKLRKQKQSRLVVLNM